MPAYSVTHHVCHIYNISKKESQDVNFIEIAYKNHIQNLHPDSLSDYLP